MSRLRHAATTIGLACTAGLIAVTTGAAASLLFHGATAVVVFFVVAGAMAAFLGTALGAALNTSKDDS